MTPNPPPSILLVEDHLSYREVVKLTLENFFPTAHLAVAETVAEALEHFDRLDFDVMVTDLTLPDGSAINLIKQMREKERHPTAVIVISNHSREEMEPLLSSSNIHRFIAKEEGLKALAVAIAEACPRLTTTLGNPDGKI